MRAQPLPRVLERTASKAADITGVDPSGMAATSVCIEEDVAGQTIIQKSQSSANISVECPQELDDADTPSASGCLAGRSCAPATLGAVLIVFLLALVAGLALCGCYYRSRAAVETDEASSLVSGKPEHRCDPGVCIFACIGLCIRDEPKGKKEGVQSNS